MTRQAQGGERPLTRRDHRARRVRRRWPWIVGGVLSVVAAAGAVGAVFVLEALSVRDDLTAAKTRITAVLDAARAGDADGAQATADEVTELVDRADRTVDGPLWAVASAFPVVGQNVAAVRDATQATHILISDALPAGLDLFRTVDLQSLTVEGGGIDLAPFQAARDVLPTIGDAFSRAEAEVTGIDRAALLPFVDDAVGQLIDVVAQAAPAVDILDRYLPTLLSAAGAEEPRDYLVLFQNNAEIRATGGNSASSFVLTIDGGRITMSGQASAATYDIEGTSGRSYVDLPEDTLALYEDDFDLYAQNFSRTPDFPTTAALSRAIWAETSGQEVDGVISIDPIVLSYMLLVAGPVALPDGSVLQAQDTVKVLLSDAYERFGMDGTAADAYFAAVAAGVFANVLGGSWDPVAMLEQLQRAAAEKRISLWFADPQAEELAVELDLAGTFAPDNTERTQLGFFLNEAGYSKLSYYLSSTIDVSCDPAARTATVTATLANTVPTADLSGWTLSWRAPSLGISRTSMILDTVFFAPPGGDVVAADPAVSDLEDWDRTGTEQGRSAVSKTIVIPMGETRTVSYTASIPADAVGPLDLRFSPGVSATPVTFADSCAELS